MEPGDRRNVSQVPTVKKNTSRLRLSFSLSRVRPPKERVQPHPNLSLIYTLGPVQKTSPSLPIISRKSVALKMEGKSLWQAQLLPPPPPSCLRTRPRWSNPTVPSASRTTQDARLSPSACAPGTTLTKSGPRAKIQPIGSAGRPAIRPTSTPCRRSPGLQNICDFIACINYRLHGGQSSRTTKRRTILANARIALAALSLRPKPQATGAKSGGKPLENPPGEEKE